MFRYLLDVCTQTNYPPQADRCSTLRFLIQTSEPASSIGPLFFKIPCLQAQQPMAPHSRVLCACGCDTLVSSRTARRHLHGQAKPHVKASTYAHLNTIRSVTRPRPHESTSKTHNTPPEPIPACVQDDFTECMDWSAAASPVRSTSCEAPEPNFSSSIMQPSSSEPSNHRAPSLHTRPVVESEDEDKQDLSPASNSDSSGYLSSSEDEPEDSH